MKNKILLSCMISLWILSLVYNTAIAEENSLMPPRPGMLPPESVMIAKYTQKTVVLDGKLDDQAWKSAETYSLALADDRAGRGETLEEGAEVQLAWDDQYLYIGVKYIDSEIIAEGTQDQLPHFMLGDVCEVFLKPKNQPWYWELFATPLAKKSHLWWPKINSIGSYDAYNNQSDMKVAASCQGTPNQPQDRDQYWIVEIAMPIRDLAAKGAEFQPGDDWSIMVARYNYSRYLNRKGPELSMNPKLTKTNYHLVDEYATLLLTR